jgi:hypothetical protein
VADKPNEQAVRFETEKFNPLKLLYGHVADADWPDGASTSVQFN